MKKSVFVCLVIVVIITTNAISSYCCCFYFLLKNDIGNRIESAVESDIKCEHDDDIYTLSVENRYFVPGGSLSLDGVEYLYENEFVKKHVRIVYPEIRGTEYDDKINALIAKYPLELIEEANKQYTTRINNFPERSEAFGLITALTYNIKTVFDGVLIVTFDETGNDRVVIWESLMIINIDLRTGEEVKLTDVIMVDDRLINFTAKDYMPPGETNRNYSFQDTFPNCSVGEFLSYIDSGAYGWNLEDEYLCLFNSDSRHGSYIQIPYTEISDLINSQYKEMLLG